ncbi:hypothetical protein [uncultured Duncaniella sp.]|uniref:hypothetical protein n=2 Tax=uncultured Duncaniella sp. TaxID=2768039 RepID=UPI00272A9702|nr:hypothetical protein [uncultured Duncaniella sp.]
MTDIMNGLLYINGRDVWSDFGAWLTEEKEGDTKNYSALQKPPATKSHVAVSFREQDGEKLPKRLVQKWEPRDIALKFAVAAADRESFIARRDAFVSFLKDGSDGWLDMRVPELGRTYRIYYKDCSDYEHLEDIGGMVAARFTVVFREPNPEF